MSTSSFQTRYKKNIVLQDQKNMSLVQLFRNGWKFYATFGIAAHIANIPEHTPLKGKSPIGI